MLLLFSFAATFTYSVTLGLDQLDTLTMSSYDPIPPDGVITQAQFKASMKLVRLQIAVPISVLASISANIVCALAIKPGLRGSLFPVVAGARYPSGIEVELTPPPCSRDQRSVPHIVEPKLDNGRDLLVHPLYPPEYVVPLLFHASRDGCDDKY